MPTPEEDFLAERYGPAAPRPAAPAPRAPVAPPAAPRAPRAAPSAGDDEIGAFLDQRIGSLEEERAARMRTAITAAARGNPDQAAERQRLASTSGLPLRVIERDMEDIKAREFTRGLGVARLAAQSPILAHQLTDPNFTQVAVDDIPTLSTLEQSIGRAVRYMMGADRGGGIMGTAAASLHESASAFASVKKAAVDVGSSVLSPLLGPDNWWERTSRYYGEQAAGFHAQADAARPASTSRFGQFVDAGFQSLFQNLKYMPLGMLGPGGAGAALSGMVGEQFGSSYGEADRKGLPLWQKLGFAGSQAAVEYWTEKVPLGRLLEDVKVGLPFVRTLMGQLRAEIPREQLATVLQDLNEWATLNPEKPFKDYLAARPDAAMGTLVATVIGVGGNVTVAQAVGKVADSLVGAQWRDQISTDFQQTLAEQMKIAGRSALLQRSPDQFRTLVQQMVDSGAPTTAAVFVDGEVLAQMPQAVLDQLPASVTSQIADAAAAGATVPVPLETVLSVAPGTPLEQALVDHGRLSPDMPSPAEAAAASREARQRVETAAARVMAQAADQEALQASREQVRSTLEQQIVATRRFQPRVATAMAEWAAAFYTAYGGALGLTPDQMYARFPLRVSGAPTAAGSTLSASRPGQLDNVEAYHFSTEARPAISTGAFGTGLKGSGREGYLAATDSRRRQRSYFYVDKGTGINPEAGVGGIGHRVNLSNVYDADSDPLRLRTGDQAAFETAVLDAGYSGYLTRLEGTQSGQVVMLGPQTFQAEVLGPTTRTTGRVVAPPAARESTGPFQVTDRLKANKGLPGGALTPLRWSEVLAAQMPTEHAAMEAAGTFTGEDPLYKDELIRRFEALAQEAVLAQPMSTRVPTGKKSAENPLASRLDVGLAALERAPRLMSAVVDKVSRYVGFKQARGSLKNEAKIMERVLGQMVDNLLWLHDTMPPAMRERARLWYDGARVTIDRWVDRYEGRYTDAQIAGVIASLSPQKDWYQNMSLAERVLDMYDTKQDFRWSPEMEATQATIKGLEPYPEHVAEMRGRTLKEVLYNPLIAAKWMVVYDRAHNNKAYRAVTPEGDFLGYEVVKSGELRSSTWGSFSTVAKALLVLHDGSLKNISAQLGVQHKVRSFYNNMLAPNDPTGDLTIDTHAVAAAQLRTLSAASQEVLDNFGDAGSDINVGLIGSYALYQEAYRRAAEQRGMLPREMQSITWEAVRGLFTPTFKAHNSVDDIWQDVDRKKETIDGARDRILAAAGGITPPTWTTGPGDQVPPGGFASSYSGELLGDGWTRRALAPRDRVPSAGLADAGQRAALSDFTPQGLPALLSKTHWAVLTAEDPGAQKATPEANAAAMAALQADLDAMGAQYLPVVGKYGDVQNSLIVTNIDERAAFDLGTKYGQESVLTRRGLVYTRDGSITPATGVEVFEQPPADFYTEVPGTGAFFSVQLRWNDGQAGTDQLLAQQGRADQGNGGARETDGSLRGLPRRVGAFTASAFTRAQEVARKYMAQAGLQYSPPTTYAKVDPERAKRIAAAFDAMQHTPQDPEVKAAYDAMIDETLAQYRAVLASGLKVEFITGEDPYKGNPRAMTDDVRDNNHMWVFSTRDGFGTDASFDPADNPLLRETGFEISGQMALANDIFRVVHDYFGHVKEGVGFRADGEENAWRAHMAMYSPLARRAATTETRGQNSWLNFGPFGESNRTAKVEDTHFADQKIGLLPQWVVDEGRTDPVATDLFPETFAGTTSTVRTSRVISSKGDTQPGGNVNSAGQRITATVQGLQNFWNWFGQSEATDDSGRPLVMYHSTNADVTAFEAGRETTNNYGFLGDVAVKRSGIFLTPSRDFSQEYLRSGSGQNVMPVYAKLENPLDLRGGAGPVWDKLETAGVNPKFVHNLQNTWELFDAAGDGSNEAVDALRAAGYDGAIFNEDSPSGETAGGTTYVVFEPTQIKSATGNRGTFDPNDPSIVAQTNRGTFNPASLELVLGENADLSTWFHETGHFFLEVLMNVASGPNAPAPLVRDRDTVLKWFGLTADQWLGMTLDEKRKYHERWAESIEQYVMEGKVPNNDLQPLMRRFALWLRSVYQSIQRMLADKPDAATMPLSDDVRRVMDRMLATDEQIEQAEEAAGMLPDDEATAEAMERLRKRSMRDLKWAVRARDKVIKKMQKEAAEIEKTIRAEVTAEVDQLPVVRAAAALEEAQKAFDEAPMAADFNAAAIADAFGFRTVDHMYREIEAFPGREATIDARTQQRMLEAHGDLIDERAIADAALEAVHNEARARALATELRAQEDMVGARRDTGEKTAKGAKKTVSVLVEAAKQFGAKIVARTPIKDLKNVAWRHTAAERSASTRWREATAGGNTEAAVKAKQDQTLNNAAARAALEARVEAKKILEFFARVAKGSSEDIVEKGRDPDYVNAARAVLAAYGAARINPEKVQGYLDTLQKLDPDIYADIQPRMMAGLLNAQPIEALTFEELQVLHEQVEALWFLAKESRTMEVAGDRVDIEDAGKALFTRMEAVGIPATRPGEGKAITDADMRKYTWLQAAPALLRRVEQWAQAKDGKFGGPFFNYIFRPVKEAADRYRAERLAYRKAFSALVEKVAPAITGKEIDAPELGYTFGAGAAGVGHAELLHAILHTGNDSNKRKLLLGRGWATDNGDGTIDTTKWDTFVERLISDGTLSKVHFEFAQGVWDLLEQTKKGAQQAHRRVFGRYFDEVTATPFENTLGSWRGGYVPALADSMLTPDAKTRALAERENESMAHAFPGTAKGFTKSRVEYNRPLKLDLHTLPQHIDKVLLFTHLEVPVRAATKLLKLPMVSQPLDKMDPAAYDSMLNPWLQRAARQVVETPIAGDGRLNRYAALVRARVGMSLMFANVSNSVQQITGFSNALTQVKGKHLMGAMGKYLSQPTKFREAVWAASASMEDRAKNEVSVLNDTMDRILIDPNAFQKTQTWFTQHAYFLQSAIDNVMSPIVWTGAYNQALAEGMSHEDAVAFGDSVVRRTQGSTLPEDVSRFETGPAFARLFTQFFSYFNMLANTNATAIQQIAGEMGLKKGAGKALGVVFFGVLLPVWIAEAIALAFKGGPDDGDGDGYLDDWLVAVFGLGTLKGFLAQVPLVGMAVQSAVNRFNTNPADDKFSMSPAISVLESAVGAPYSVYKAIVEDGSAQKAVRDVAAVVTVATGIPATAIARPLGYLAGVADNRIVPMSPVDAARGVVTGVASPQSKSK